MSDTAEFFDELSRRGYEPLLQRVAATIRFEVSDPTDGAGTVSRLVTVDRGNLIVSTDGGDSADATIGCEATELEALLSGRTSAMASLLRGALTVQGNPELVVLAQRLFSRHSAPTSVAGATVGEDRPS